jgi:glycosyltransferase involved in cell wall biosynthesis
MPVRQPLFTILLPIVRPPALLPFAIQSVGAQIIQDFELFVICDGAPDETRVCANRFAAEDDRIRVFAFDKGERNGEAHRHTALAEASGRYVAHIADDDLWFPDHLTELAKLLAKVDFGNLTHVYVVDGKALALPGDLASKQTRDSMLSDSPKYNFFGLSVAGYRLDAYRRLPEGWAPAPKGIWTDLHMWRKFLRCPGVTAGTRVAITSLQFATPQRKDLTLEARGDENRCWFERIRDPAQRDTISQEVLLRISTESERLRLAALAARKEE